MRITNTSKFTRAEIAEAIRHARPAGLRHFLVEVTDTRTCLARGRAWPESNRVLVRVNRRGKFPMTGARKGKQREKGSGYMVWPWFASDMEVLVYIMAHELRHIWQAQVPRGYRVWGARGQYSERDTDAYAWKCLRSYRRTV
jgi:hypothetical protein